MMTITIEVPPDDNMNVGVRTVARDMLRDDVKPHLQRAIKALQAELDAVDDCPWHKRHPQAADRPGEGERG